MPRVFHIGRRSGAFDMLGEDLIVAEFEREISPGRAQVARGFNDDGTLEGEAMLPFREKLSADGRSGFRAFKPEDGEIYLVEGIEWVPAKVARYVRFTAAAGFEPLDVAEAERQLKPPPAAAKADLPELEGTTQQVAWAIDLREQLVEKLRGADLGHLIPKLRRRRYSSWYIKNRITPIEQIAQELEAL